MENLDISTLISYLLAAVGSGVLGFPHLKKLWNYLKTLKPLLPAVTASQAQTVAVEPVVACKDSLVRMTAENLLSSAFVFQQQGNGAGVKHCLDALSELTGVEKEPKA
jgi:CBS domain containing-hemolysin-like protein